MDQIRFLSPCDYDFLNFDKYGWNIILQTETYGCKIACLHVGERKLTLISDLAQKSTSNGSKPTIQDLKLWKLVEWKLLLCTVSL